MHFCNPIKRNLFTFNQCRKIYKAALILQGLAPGLRREVLLFCTAPEIVHRAGGEVSNKLVLRTGEKKGYMDHGRDDFQKASEDLWFKGLAGLGKLWLWSNNTGTDKLSRRVRPRETWMLPLHTVEEVSRQIYLLRNKSKGKTPMWDEPLGSWAKRRLKC